MWNASTRDAICKFENAHIDPVSCVKFTPDENYIVSTSKDDTLKVWDLRKQKLLSAFEHDAFKVGSTQARFCVSPNSQYVICGSKNGAVVYYDIKAMECESIIQNQHKSMVIACDWQPLQKGDKYVRLATVDDLGGLLVWG